MGNNCDNDYLCEIARTLAHIEQLLQDMPERLLELVPEMYLAYAKAEAKTSKLAIMIANRK